MARILLVDDDPALRLFVEHALKGEGHELYVAPDASDIFDRLETKAPDLVLLDVTLPEVPGHDVLKAIRLESQYDTIPIVLFSSNSDTEAKIRGLDLGAIDYLEKPIPAPELAARVRALVRQKKRHDELLSEYQRLSELSLTDPLTGAYNRRALNAFLRSRIAESQRHHVPFACALFDLDHFKRVNDTHGHDTGDLVLKEVAALTIALFRQEDTLIRYGGEEFLAILLHTPREGARTFAERLRAEVATRVFNKDQIPLNITLSVGVACHPEDGNFREPEGMITLADKRLYAAKNAGRNRVIFEG